MKWFLMSAAAAVVLATHDAETAALADRTGSLLDGRRVTTLHLPPVQEAENRGPEGRGPEGRSPEEPGSAGGRGEPGGRGVGAEGQGAACSLSV